MAISRHNTDYKVSFVSLIVTLGINPMEYIFVDKVSFKKSQQYHKGTSMVIRYITIDECWLTHRVYSKWCEHGFTVICLVVVILSVFIIDYHDVSIHFHQSSSYVGAKCQWSNPAGYWWNNRYATKHDTFRTVCMFIGIYYINRLLWN